MGRAHGSVNLAAETAATACMLVDTGATFSVISEALPRTVGIEAFPAFCYDAGERRASQAAGGAGNDPDR